MGKNRVQEIIIGALNYGKWNAVGCGWVKATTSIASRSQYGILLPCPPFRPYSSFPFLDSMDGELYYEYATLGGHVWTGPTFDIIDIQELFNRFIIISGLIDQPPWQPLLFTALLRFLLIYWFVSGPQFILPSTHKHWKDVLWVSLLPLLFLCLVKKMDLTLSHQVCLSCVPMGGWSVPIIPSVHRQEPINSQWKTCGSIMRECNQPKGIRAGVCEWWWPGRRRIWIKWSCLEAYEWAMNEWGRDMVGWVGN